MRTAARPVAGAIVCVTVALGVVACASSGPRPTPEDGDRAPVIRFTVVNDIVPRTPAVVHLVSEDGVTTFLGSVSPDAEKTFEVPRPNASGRHALLAETGQGGEIRSSPFNLFPDAWIGWKLTSPSVSVGYTHDEADDGGEDEDG